MKTTLFITIISLFLLSISSSVVAQTATLSTTPTVSDKAQQLENLKDRLATKVAELRQSQRMAIFGKIKSVSISTFTVETKTKDLKIELTDDIKIFQILKGKRTELKTDNLEKGDVVTVFGEYDSTLELLKAKVVFIQGIDPVRASGTITDVKKIDYTITIESGDKKIYIIDFETTTKTAIWNGSTQEKGGFSKFTLGDIIHVTGTAVPKKENRISASRILTVIGQIKGVTTSVTPTPTP
ncbi:MAG: hypothetical protein V1917_01840 [Candidatus Gottesmanbacteria bacterium]